MQRYLYGMQGMGGGRVPSLWTLIANAGLRESLGTPHGELSPLAVPEGSIVESDAAKIEQAAGSKGCSGGEEGKGAGWGERDARGWTRWKM